MPETHGKLPEAPLPIVGKESGASHEILNMQGTVQGDVQNALTPADSTSKKDPFATPGNYRKHLGYFLDHKCYEDALRMIRSAGEFGVTVGQMHEDARRLIRMMILEGAQDFDMAYPSMTRPEVLSRYVTWDDQGRISTDGRTLHKYDLIESMPLTRDFLDQVLFEVLMDLCTQCEEMLRHYASSYDRSGDANRLHSLTWRALQTQYKLPLRDPELLQRFQERVRTIAPSLLRMDRIAELQDLGQAAKISEYDERPAYADTAIGECFAFTGDPYRFTSNVWTILRLQEKYQPPVTPERRELARSALSYFISSAEDMKRFVTCFGLSEEDLHAAVVTSATEHVTEEMKSTREDYPQYRGEFPYVSQLEQDYGLSIEEVGPLKLAIDEVQSACMQSGAVSLEQVLKHQHDQRLDLFVPKIARVVFSRVMREPDRTQFAAVRKAMEAAPTTKGIWKEQCLSLLRERHDSPLLDLSEPEERALWMLLWNKQKTCPGALLEVRNFLGKAGLPAEDVRAAWDGSVNESEEMNVYGVRYCDFLGHSFVYERNMCRIAELEKSSPGAAAALHRQWKISMFCRYPPAVLLRQAKEDTALQRAPHRETLQSWLDEAGLNVQLRLPVNPEEWNPTTLEVAFRESHSLGYLDQQSLQLKHPNEHKSAFLRRFASMFDGKGLLSAEVQRVNKYASAAEKGERAQRTKPKKKNVLVIYPQHDWNSAFERPEHIQDIADQASADECNFRIAESGKKSGCLRRLMQFCRKFGKVDFAEIGGHSDGSSVTIGNGKENLSLEDFHIANSAQALFLQRLRSFFTPEGKIIFNSCSTGKDVLENGKSGLARKTRELLEISA
ncbi:MAG: hypothetical protein WCG83_06160, partial [Candidatus Peregrinibacteria bacterium]